MGILTWITSGAGRIARRLRFDRRWLRACAVMAGLALLSSSLPASAQPVGLAADVANASGAGTVRIYQGIGSPEGITAGPDGALWFTNYGNNSIERITTTGKITIYTGTGIDEPEGIAAGPDGAPWFTNYGNDSIGRISTTGTVTNYTGTGIDEPEGITAGPDGALWFVDEGNNTIGRISTTATP
jgi:streptogramin lyase